jgi:hypothetical protein
MEGVKFTLGAALMFEELSGKSVKALGEDMGLNDMVKLIYAQQYWNDKNRPTLEAFTEELSAQPVEALAAYLNAPFSQPVAQ